MAKTYVDSICSDIIYLKVLSQLLLRRFGQSGLVSKGAALVGEEIDADRISGRMIEVAYESISTSVQTRTKTITGPRNRTRKA